MPSSQSAVNHIPHNAHRTLRLIAGKVRHGRGLMTQSHIASRLALSERTVRRMLDILVRAGLIARRIVMHGQSRVGTAYEVAGLEPVERKATGQESGQNERTASGKQTDKKIPPIYPPIQPSTSVGDSPLSSSSAEPNTTTNSDRVDSSASRRPASTSGGGSVSRRDGQEGLDPEAFPQHTLIRQFVARYAGTVERAVATLAELRRITSDRPEIASRAVDTVNPAVRLGGVSQPLNYLVAVTRRLSAAQPAFTRFNLDGSQVPA